MTITYEEFDSTPATLIADLKTKILSNTHWTDQGVVGSTTTSTANTASNGSTVNLTSSAGFTIGSYLTAGVGLATEATFVITNVVGNQVTISGTWGVVYTTGTTFKTRNVVLKSTSDRGANLIVDLEGAGIGGGWIGVATYWAYTGTAPGGQTDQRNYWVWWRPSGTDKTMPIHVTLSVGKNHLYFSIEGPRPNEPFTSSTTYGSIKSYFAMCDLIPYHASDIVPAVVGIGGGNTSYQADVNQGHHLCYISRDSTDTVSWGFGRLASLDWPTMFNAAYVTMPRECTIDGNSYLFPYVVFSETEGIRGRLSSFFYAGGTAVSPLTDFPEAVGTKVVFDGIVYKLVAVNKGDATYNPWGPFGAITMSTAPMRSIVVAVPFAVAT